MSQQSCSDETQSAIDKVLDLLIDALGSLAQQSACVALGTTRVAPDGEIISLLQSILPGNSEDCSSVISQDQASMQEFISIGDKIDKTKSVLEDLQEALSICDDDHDTSGGRRLLFHIILPRIICMIKCLTELLQVYYGIIGDGVITLLELVRWLQAILRFRQCIFNC
eukprot:TRINITY_DN5272_c0_g1_i3.p1 TRINITY_DN5272_c0_g1~~TRINITY_DN5272_c0_g1_i3.p1  ORF type:complete len:196 (-),score=14.30 TRINITY_DN5272_c0_g1_i3:351-854(-)